MADIDISRNVAAPTQGEALPKSYHRNVQAEITHNPDIQSAGMQFASATNWMSAIGSEVAAKSSQAIASQIGAELGKNPRGDIGASFTDFDKMMHQSYNTQAQATLGLQAHKLITDTNVELARQPRLSPDMISKAQASIGKGLSDIVKNAPTEIKAHLEYQFGNQAINQSAQLTERMIHEQRQDWKNNIALSSSVNAENAYSLRMQGNEKAAEDLIETTKAQNAPLVAAGLISGEEAKNRIDTVRKSLKNAQVAHDYDQAKKIGQGDEYLKLLQEGKIKGLSKDNPDYASASQYALSFVNQQNALRAEYDNLRIAQFNTAVLQDPLKAASQLQELKDILSPLAFEKANLHVLTAIKTQNKQNLEYTDVQTAWTNSDFASFNRQTDSSKDKAFYTNVDRYIKSATDSGNTISRDEAETAVAASAPGKIPAFIKALNGRGNSSNPVELESLGRAISYLREAKKGSNLEGLDEKAVAISDLYQTLRRSKIPQEAAEIAYNNVYNQSSQDKIQLQQNWAATIETIKKTGKLTYFSSLGGINKDLLVDPLGYVEQSETLLHANFELTKGDLETAKKMTEQEIKSVYGETHVNGHKQITFMPLESIIGLPHDAAGYIQEDIVEYVNDQLKSTKEAFLAGALPYYWEVEPRRSIEGSKTPSHDYTGNPLVFGDQNVTSAVNRIINEETRAGSDIVIHKHWKNGTRETFPLIIKADPWLSKTPNHNQPYTAGWDIVLGTKNGYSPIFRENPMMGQFLVYKPDIKKIQNKYMKDQWKS